MERKRLIPLALALLIAVPAGWAVQGDTQPPERMHGHERGPEDRPEAACQAMQERHQAMRERMASMDAELERLVDEMRSATGEDKLEATAEAVEALVEQRTSMHAMMLEHQPMMMGHMMEHMGMGDAMDDCPMMQTSAHHSGPE